MNEVIAVLYLDDLSIFSVRETEHIEHCESEKLNNFLKD